LFFPQDPKINRKKRVTVERKKRP